ncbi:N-methylhydantoinase A [Thermocatellispora tengchongensis]|uniref:N-methylhydantoinase A n=1 Tax=Thermocatellispora tengchongensis TaxID=1073253 RepID=A0A840NZQ4_9ACTN|nr:hydantoinase/oxoprolinase family protein [Thermocatellispora tengchongensis]MBB5134404.1 N-methylhydantoinase A [Thermocatellispora tengchongensis]
MSRRLGIDVGGTFTDVVVIDDDGRVLVEKVPSTPDNQAGGVLDGVRAVRRTHGVDPGALSMFAHGSTVATNALLEFKLPRTALVVTRGFRDVLEIGTQLRPALFDLGVTKPEPVIPRELVFEIDERVDRLGEVVTPLADAEIDRVVDQVAASGAEACAVVLLFSFRNPGHERRVAARLAERLPGVHVAVSSEVAPEIKEYPRASTTAISAALRPLVARYLSAVEAGLEGERVTCPFFVMQSSGGALSAAEASAAAHKMVLSGPAAGVLAAARVAERPEYANQITFDMGGTSTDICLIHEGRPRLDRASQFEGRPLQVAQFDIHTIGSGGGSLARVDAAGMLRVGPESAGAVPGPACYGRGGTRPTTTDAQVVLGRVDPARFLGGEMTLDAEAAREAVRAHVAEPLGLSVEEAAQGILDVADAIMARGVRVVSVNRGYDPRDFMLLPFGGAGPMHAVSVAELVDIRAVLVPPNPGTFSAVGLATSDLTYDFSRTVDAPVDTLTPEGIEELFAGLLGRARDRLARVEHLTTGRIENRLARFRYAWQDNDVEVLLRPGPVDEESLADALDRFHAQHEFEFGHSDKDARVELVAVAVEVHGVLPRPSRRSAPPAGAAAPAPVSVRQVFFRGPGWTATPVYERAGLAPGAAFHGPAIVEEREATTVVPPGTRVRVDDDLNLVLTLDANTTEGGAA